MVTTWAVLLIAGTVGLSPGLSVETGSPDALCPELSATRAAVEARLGVVGVQGRAGWIARYTNWHAPGTENADFVRLQIIDPDGTQRLERDLPLAGESCATMSRIIALVLDGYFRELKGDLSAPGSPDHSPGTSGEEARYLAGMAPAGSSGSATGAAEGLGDAPAARPVKHHHMVFGSAGGVLTGPAKLGLTLDVAIEGPRARLALQAAWAPARHSETPGDTTVLTLKQSIPVRLAAEWRSNLGSVRLHAGPELMLAYERASSTGVASPGENSRLAVGAGLHAGAAFPLDDSLRVTLDVALDRVLGGGQFSVDDRDVLQLPWRGLATIGLAFATGGE